MKFFRWLSNSVDIVNCPDGSTRRVYSNVDQVLPLYLREVRSNTKAAANVADKVRIQLGQQYTEKIGGLLFGINELNSSAQTQLRAAYVVYASSPCDQIEYLKDKIDEISRREHTLRTVAIILTQLNALLSNGLEMGGDAWHSLVDRYLHRAMDVLSEGETPTALVREMSKVRQNAIDWSAE